ncbi:MAG: molecular chaperone [Hyphomicrobiales bacterium]
MAATSQPAAAASLQVAPVIVDIPAPGATGTITLRNEGLRPIDAQVRVFRWTQENGVEKLEPTRDVVASPPIVKLNSRSDYTVRVVRLSKKPASGEEAYRLVVDELPDPGRAKNGAVVVVLRHSIPVFFAPADGDRPKIAWSTEVRGGQLLVSAKNAGGRRMRFANMNVSDGRHQVNFGNGLVGYSLAGSTMTWSRPAPKGFGGSVRVAADSDSGPIEATAK